MAAADLGRACILPASFRGSRRYMEQLYQNACALANRFGRPALFITMTTNTNWREIKDNLLEGQTPQDRPDLVVRAYNVRKKQ